MKDDAFIIIILLIAGFLLGLVIVFYSASYLLTYLTDKKSSITRIISDYLQCAQPYVMLFYLAIFLICVILSTLYYSQYFLPYPVSYPATQTVSLFNVTTVITGFAFFLTQILLFYFVFKYRVRANRKPAFLKNFAKLELVWTVVPTLVFLFLFLWGHVLWSKIIDEPAGDVLEIEVMGQQFSWWVRYPGKDKHFGRSDFGYISEVNIMGIDPSDPNGKDDFMPIQLHVIKNKTVQIRLRSKDVIHSFFIPHMRVKMDAVPGMITKIHFTPTTSTKEMREKLNNPTFNYEVACAELCGRMHFAMKLILVVDEPEEFETWANGQVPGHVIPSANYPL